MVRGELVEEGVVRVSWYEMAWWRTTSGRGRSQGTASGRDHGQRTSSRGCALEEQEVKGMVGIQVGRVEEAASQ